VSLSWLGEKENGHFGGDKSVPWELFEQGAEDWSSIMQRSFCEFNVSAILGRGPW